METGEEAELAAEARALARRWPRELIQAGEADALAARWVASRRAAWRAGLPPFARGPLTAAPAAALFEARRARRVVRGLEDVEKALAAQAQGLAATAGQSPSGLADRISRLLVVSEDGADRFFRKVESLYREYGKLLEVWVWTCDEQVLGESAFGAGQRARALLIDHKEAVVQVLRALGESA